MNPGASVGLSNVGAHSGRRPRPRWRARSRRRRAGRRGCRSPSRAPRARAPAVSTMQLPRRKSPCTIVLSRCSGIRDASTSCTRSMAGHVVVLRRLELRVPALELTADQLVAARRGRRAPPRRRRPRAARPGRRPATAPPCWRAGLVEGRSRPSSTSLSTMPGDVLHHVERRAEHVGVRAVRRAPRAPARGVGPSAAMMRCSRPMSCAVASTPWSGGRRTTTPRPSASVDAHGDVRLAAGDDLGGERWGERRGARRRPSAAKRVEIDPRGAPWSPGGPISGP